MEPLRVKALPFTGDRIESVAQRIRRDRQLAEFLRQPIVKDVAAFAFRVCDKLLSYRVLADQYAKIDQLRSTLGGQSVTLDSTGYQSNQDELRVAMGYKDEIVAGLSDTSFSKILYERQEVILRDLIQKDKIDKFVNFGVSYAYIDNILAKQFPQVQFVGIDRSLETKRYNEFEFKGVPNLRFEAADIRSFLASASAQNGVFFHARTGTYVARPILEEIYVAARNAGYRTIAGFEPFGMSRLTGEPYEFSLSERESIPYLYGMIIHNYPALLQKAGFELIHLNVLTTAHAHPDHRLLEFVAKC
jgi:hypothetical protein